MVFTQQDADKYIKELYLITIFHFEPMRRADIPKTISRSFNITDEKLESAINALCVLAGMSLNGNGDVKLVYDDPEYSSIARVHLTSDGKFLINNILNSNDERLNEIVTYYFQELNKLTDNVE